MDVNIINFFEGFLTVHNVRTERKEQHINKKTIYYFDNLKCEW